MYDEIGKHLGAGLETDLILLDFAKAFDCLPHQTASETKLVWCTWSSSRLVWKLPQPSNVTRGRQWIFLKLEPVKV